MGKIFTRGLIAIAPIVITIAAITWMYKMMETAFAGFIIHFIGAEYYFNGLGIIVALIAIFIIGIIVNTIIMQKVYSWGEGLLKRIPLVKTLYNSIYDIMSFFRTAKASEESRVVMVEVMGTRLIGIVTRETFEDLSWEKDGVNTDEEIAVFLPLSYQIGGFTVLIPRSQVKPVDMTMEEGLRFSMTAWVPGKNQ
ncbi:MAG: DUF502 domain-containing protein [Waddliaceae bacterium]|nr:DUF502 domain-containing protein [Waddliaceae bacterium]